LKYTHHQHKMSLSHKSDLSSSDNDSDSGLSIFTVKDEVMFQVLSEFLVVNKNNTTQKNIATVLYDINTQLSHIKDALNTIAAASSK